MDDWSVGDLALCVDDQPCGVFPGSEGGVTKGAIYEVENVKVLPDLYGISRCALRLDRHNPIHPATGAIGSHAACRFRKIHPLTDEEHRDAIIELAADQRIPVEV